VTGETTRSPNKTFLIRRITEALQAAEAGAKTAKAKAPEADAHDAEVETTAQTEAAPAREKLTKLDVPTLQARYLEVVGRSTGSDNKAYVERADMLSCDAGEPGKPQRAARSAPHIRIKVLPLRMETTVVQRVDEARLRLGLASRAELFRQALHHYFVGAGEREVAGLFLRDGEA
jgi:hypothetical protein